MKLDPLDIKRMAGLAEKIWDDTATSEEIREWQNLYERDEKEKTEQRQVKSKEMRNRRRRGKYAEKKLAQDVGGIRVGGPGMPDVVVEGMFTYESKVTKRIPTSILNLMSQARRLARKDTIPVGVMKYKRDSYYIVSGQDWKALHRKD